jgi:RimJ/RimL family protein N-acetyltransferase
MPPTNQSQQVHASAMASPVNDFTERLESKRLYLRPYREDDAAWYAVMTKRNHDHLARFESGNAAFGITGVPAARKVLRTFAALRRRQEAFFLGVFLRKTDAFVAQVYVGVANAPLPRFTLGFFVDEAREGKGYVTEAVAAVIGHLFGPMRAHKVDLWCDDKNERCRRLAERCGFVQEAHLSDDKRNADGSISGTCVYAIFGDAVQHE